MTLAEAMRRLGSVEVGRIVFTRRALPAVRPVNHLVDDGAVIICSHEGSAIVTAAEAGRGVVVAYEADQLDPATRAGWSVVVTGRAHLVEDPQQARRYRDRLRPWVTGPLDQVIRISPQIVTGFTLTAAQRSTQA
jgi:nitroimidazol reductase NimA-like FMN-containing flavoprotein (pyridoxamine 5'-phosphate oxidase superfamily)